MTLPTRVVCLKTVSAVVGVFLAAGVSPAAGAAEPGPPEAAKTGAGPALQGSGGRIPSLEFQNTGLALVLDYVAQAGRLSLTVDWPALEEAGLTKDRPISLTVKNLSALKCLELVLEQARFQGGSLAFVADAKGVAVSTEERLDTKKSSKTYDISRLLVAPPRTEPVEAPRQVVTKRRGPGGVIIEQRVEGGAPSNPSGVPPIPDQIANIERVIQNLVSPDSWPEQGGDVAAMKADKATLVITAPARIHAQVAELLALLQAPGGAGARQPAAKAAEASLAKALPNLEFEKTAFGRVLDFFRAAGGLNLVVCRQPMEVMGIDSQVPISVKASGVTLSQALRLVLAQAGKGDGRLDFLVDNDGVVWISTREDLAARAPLCAYPIQDLVTPRKGEEGTTAAERCERLMSLIVETIEPESWVGRGGREKALGEVRGVLLVRALPSSQKRVDELLAKYRAAAGIPRADR